ncbi:MAG: methylmalonyl-CoA epimerase [Hyphomicrobiales bacterium]|nr:MAG: methylmalonyl-CoA epimerase [Hyphomicrobiales bacterium]|tara:strand:- start:997 stop:1659 length:663 start_codon:yes stop_codon:yes gene_type:complete
MKLLEYLKIRNITPYRFAKEIGFSKQCIYNYIASPDDYNFRIPTAKHMKRILEFTGGKVRPTDFIEVIERKWRSEIAITEDLIDLKKVVFDHVAHAVPNIEEAIIQYENIFGLSATKIKIIEKQKIKMALIHLGKIKIELMEPLDDQSPIAKFLFKNPSGGLHHYCLGVKDINETYKDQKNKGLNILSEPSKGYHGRSLYFIHPKELSGALIEVEEHEKE